MSKSESGDEQSKGRKKRVIVTQIVMCTSWQCVRDLFFFLSDVVANDEYALSSIGSCSKSESYITILGKWPI